jgi:putative transposase
MNGDSIRFLISGTDPLTLGEMAGRTSILIHAFALMDNHYHLVLETPRANLVDGMQWFQNTYTRRFNVKHKVWGHLFGGRYKAVLVQSDGGDYFSTLIDYVHLNPVRAGMIKQGQGFDESPWTSLREYRKPPTKRQPWMATSSGFEAVGLEDTSRGRKAIITRNWDMAGSTLKKPIRGQRMGVGASFTLNALPLLPPTKIL